MSYAGISGVERGLNKGIRAVEKDNDSSFSDMRDRQQSVAGLWASQAAIYQRYGFSINNFKSIRLIPVNVRFNETDTELLKVSRYLPGGDGFGEGLYRVCSGSYELSASFDGALDEQCV